MTTYEQLWNDKNFLITRIFEQEAYIYYINQKTNISPERRNLILQSASTVGKRFLDRLIEVGFILPSNVMRHLENTFDYEHQ